MRRDLRAQAPAFAVLLVVGGLSAYGLGRAGGAAAAILAVVATACALALVARLEPETIDSRLVERMSDAALLALPGLLVLYFSFNSGGYFPQTPAFAAGALALLLILRTTLAEHPFAGFSGPLAVAAGALSLYALWTLLSGSWSDAPSRALIEFDRALAYLLVLVLMGTLPRTSDRLRWILRLLALAIVLVAAVALTTRVLPHFWPTEPNIVNRRLSYPLSYWNSLGILGSIGAILALHLTSSLREPRAVRVAAAAVLPVLACTVFFTFSRGAIAAGIVGLAVYALVARPRGLVTGLAAAAPPTAIAIVVAYGADLLATDRPTTSAAIDQGHDVALAVALCAVFAGVIRLGLSPVDVRLARFRLPEERRRLILRSAWAAFAATVVIAAIAVDAPGRVSSNYDRFVHTRTPKGGSKNLRARLVDPANNGRVDHWRVGIRGFETKEFDGQGAATYGLLWSRQRPQKLARSVVRDAHSLYVETLDELGLVGMTLLAACILAILGSFLPVRRKANRSLYSALFAVGATWALHAGVDWDWEMPATTAWFFGLGGAALATHQRVSVAAAPGQTARLIVSLLLLATVVAPGLVLVSQRDLDKAADAFQREDCRRTLDSAADSIRTLENRPEPYEAIAYCQARRGNYLLAVNAMRRAVKRDPDNWEFRYGLALVRGAAGEDPRPDAHAARRLNPLDGSLRRYLAVLERSPRSRWEPASRSRARNERLTIVR